MIRWPFVLLYGALGLVLCWQWYARRKASALRIYSDGYEAYVAESIEEAMALQFKFVGECSEFDEWHEFHAPLLTVVDEDTGKEETKSPAEWCVVNGKGFLGGFE